MKNYNKISTTKLHNQWFFYLKKILFVRLKVVFSIFLCPTTMHLQCCSETIMMSEKHIRFHLRFI